MSFGDWLTGAVSRTGPFRVIQPWGPNLTRHSTVLSEHHNLSAAFDEVDRRIANLVEAGAQTSAITLLVIDGDGQRVDRRG